MGKPWREFESSFKGNRKRTYSSYPVLWLHRRSGRYLLPLLHPLEALSSFAECFRNRVGDIFERKQSIARGPAAAIIRLTVK